MTPTVRVLVLGSGQMGSGIARLILKKPGLTLAGTFVHRHERAGIELARLIGLEHESGIHTGADLKALIIETRPHIAIQATCSRLTEALDEINTLIQHGVNVISIAEQMAFPAASSRKIANEMQTLALKHNVTLLGTGVNPGFVLDLLIITLSGVCADIQSISATRINDLSPFGPSVLRAQGVGLSPAAFQQGLTDGSVAGHFGFPESIQMIAHALGWQIDRIEETRKPIISSVSRTTPHVEVAAGQVAGCEHSAVAYRSDEPVITLRHPQQIQPQLEGIGTGDEIMIKGTPDIHLTGRPEIPGGTATVALSVNMIPHVLNAAPGLYSMADLPPPAALLGDVRDRLQTGVLQ